MTNGEWKSKLHKEIDDHWKLTNKIPQAIYMGYVEDTDFRSNMSGGDIVCKGSQLYFAGVEVITVCKQAYFRVI